MKPTRILIALAAMACFAFAPKNEPRKISVMLDAGHGGNDFGATHGAFTEKQITAQIIEKIKALNQNNVDIRFTRLADEQMTLEARTAVINRIKPDLVLSLHVSASKNALASGTEIFTPKPENANSGQSNEFAQLLSDKFKQNLRINVRGIKPAPFHILNKSASPAMVVELGYLTNAHDRAYLTDEKSQARIAGTILEFITAIK